MTAFVIIILVAVTVYFVWTKNKGTKNQTHDTSMDSNATTITIDIDIDKYLNKIGKGDNRQREKDFQDIADLIGEEKLSENGEYCAIRGYGNSSRKGVIALVSVNEKKLLFKKTLQRPHDFHVSNNGIVVCCDWLNTESNSLAGTFSAIDRTGAILYSKKTSANVGNCAISVDGKISLFETHSSETDDSDRIFLIDIETKREISKFHRPYPFIDAKINPQTQQIQLIDNREIVFEIDFNGNQLNEVEYEKQVMNEGSVYDKLIHYHYKPDEVKLKDRKYLDLLLQSLKDENASYSFGQDKLYRMIGEYYEANGETRQTIENWEKAIEINPKVGVKKKLDLLKRKQ